MEYNVMQWSICIALLKSAAALSPVSVPGQKNRSVLRRLRNCGGGKRDCHSRRRDFGRQFQVAEQQKGQDWKIALRLWRAKRRPVDRRLSAKSEPPQRDNCA